MSTTAKIPVVDISPLAEALLKRDEEDRLTYYEEIILIIAQTLANEANIHPARATDCLIYVLLGHIGTCILPEVKDDPIEKLHKAIDDLTKPGQFYDRVIEQAIRQRAAAETATAMAEKAGAPLN